jgi:hypothetical protein
MSLPSSNQDTAIILDANSQTRFHGGVMNIFNPRFRLVLAAAQIPRFKRGAGV